jgi:ABC-2 type transport system ATP-binding protein
MLTGLASPSDGSASIMGFDITRDPYRAKEHFGVVPETSNIYDDLSAWRNLKFAGELYGLSGSRIMAKAGELLEAFEISEFKDKRAGTFSKGMKRKLTLAMALINQPDVLFLDEPTSGLDVQSSVRLKEIIRGINSDGKTVFLTTHNIEEANQLCDRVGIIVKGRLAVVDAPESLKRTINATRSIEVAFDRPGTDIQSALAALPAVTSIRKEGDKMRLFTDDPSLVAMGLLGYAQENKLRIISINTLAPSLEEAFLTIVEQGRRVET